MDISRRDALRTAAALGVSFVLPTLEGRAVERRGAEREKSLILLWMAGGPSQLETWDPHPGTKIGGPTKAIKTAIPGLEFAEHYPQMAEAITPLSVIRSLVSKEGDHERGTYLLKTGYRPEPTLRHPSLGAILTHELPAKGVDLPQHIAIGPGEWPGRGGFLGDQYDAFKIFDPTSSVQNIRMGEQGERRKRRLSNLDVLSRSFRNGRVVQTEKTLHQDTIQRALAMMQSEQLKAFELDQEPAGMRRRYGENPFGQGCLLARRLVETGVRAVEVTLNGWDTHANNFESQAENAKTLDPAFAALVGDLRERELWDSTVVLCLGEFGRTPQINPLDGRDHWPTGFSCVLGGGGLRGGQVIGKTDPANRRKEPDDPIEVSSLFATILELMGVDPGKELITPIGRPMALCSGLPIERLLP